MSTAINLPAGTIPIAAEDEARAGLYALLSRLLAAPPDAPLLQSIGAAELWVDDGGNLSEVGSPPPGTDIGWRLWDVAARRQTAPR